MSVQVSIENVSPVEVSVSEESVPVTVESSDSQSISIQQGKPFDLTAELSNSFSFVATNPESSISVEESKSVALEIDGKVGVSNNVNTSVVANLTELASYAGEAVQVYVEQENAIYNKSNLLDADVADALVEDGGFFVVRSAASDNSWVRNSTNRILNLRDVVDASGNVLEIGKRNNHTAFFQKALDACNDKKIFRKVKLNDEVDGKKERPTYDTLYIPAGEYGVDRTLVVRCNVISSPNAEVHFWQPPIEDPDVDWRDHKALFAIGGSNSDISYDTDKYSDQEDPFIDATTLHTWHDMESVIRLGATTDRTKTSCVKLKGDASAYLTALRNLLASTEGQIPLTSMTLDATARTASVTTQAMLVNPNVPESRLRILQIKCDASGVPATAEVYKSTFRDGGVTHSGGGVYTFNLKNINQDFIDDNPEGVTIDSNNILILYSDNPTYKYFLETDDVMNDENYTIARVIHADVDKGCVFFEQSGRYMVDESSAQSPYMRGKVRTSSEEFVHEIKGYDIQLPFLNHHNLVKNSPIFGSYTRVFPTVFATGTVEPDYSKAIDVRATKACRISCMGARFFSTYQHLRGGAGVTGTRGTIGNTFHGGHGFGAKRFLDIRPPYQNGLINGGYCNSNKFYDYVVNGHARNMLVENYNKTAEIRVDGIVAYNDYYNSVPVDVQQSLLDNNGIGSSSRVMCFLFSSQNPNLYTVVEEETTFDLTRVKPNYYVHVRNSEQNINMISFYRIESVTALEGGGNDGKYLIVTNYGEGDEIYGQNSGKPQNSWLTEDGTDSGNPKLHVYIKYARLGSHPSHTDPSSVDFIRTPHNLVRLIANPDAQYGNSNNCVFTSCVWEEKSGLGYIHHDLVGVTDTKYISTRAEISLKKIPKGEYTNQIYVDSCENMDFDHGFHMSDSKLYIDTRDINFAKPSAGIIFRDGHRQDLFLKDVEKDRYKTDLFNTVYIERRGEVKVEWADVNYTKDSKLSFFREVSKINERSPTLLSSHNNQVVDLEYSTNFKLPTSESGYYVDVINSNLIPMEIATSATSVSFISTDDYIQPKGMAKVINRGGNKYIVSGDLGGSAALSSTYQDILDNSYAATAGLESGRQKLQDMVVRHLEDKGIWDKIKRMGVFGQTIEAMSLMNWKDPSSSANAFELYSSTGTDNNPFSVGLGYTANGDGYINTNSASGDLEDENVTVFAYITEPAARAAAVVVDSQQTPLRLTIEIDTSSDPIFVLYDDETGDIIEDELDDDDFVALNIDDDQIIFDGVVDNEGFGVGSKIFVNDDEQNTLLGIVESFNITSVTTINLVPSSNNFSGGTRVIHANPTYKTIPPESNQVLFGIIAGEDPRMYLDENTDEISLHGGGTIGTTTSITSSTKAVALTRNVSTQIELFQDGSTTRLPQVYDNNNTVSNSLQIFRSENDIADNFSVGAFIIAEALTEEELISLKELFDSYYS